MGTILPEYLKVGDRFTDGIGWKTVLSEPIILQDLVLIEIQYDSQINIRDYQLQREYPVKVEELQHLIRLIRECTEEEKN